MNIEKLDIGGKAVVGCVAVPIALGWLLLLIPPQTTNVELGVIMIGITVCGYLLPSIIAAARKHHQTLAILLLNIFLGWTFIGWVAALVWAATAVARRNVEGRVGA